MNARDMLIMSLICFLTGLAGCNRQNEKISMTPTPQGPNTVQGPNSVWDGKTPVGNVLPDFFKGYSKTGAFPKSMVGVWEAVVNERDASKWGIKFEPDGSIKKIIHFLGGPIDLAKGGVDITGPDPNTYAAFIMGPCIARYNKTTKTLKVKIVLEYYEMQMPAGNLKGRIEDYFTGPVTEDGNTWNAEWQSVGWLEGATFPDVNYINENPDKIVFSKIVIK
jgi:hypothetical protein